MSPPAQRQPHSRVCPNVMKKKELCRSTKECPVENCHASVIHLPRHLREKHHWNVERARNAVLLHKLRCTRSRKSTKFKDYHKERRCPVDGCGAIVKRLPAHLFQKHKILKKSARYIELLQKAERFIAGADTSDSAAVESLEDEQTDRQPDHTNVCDDDGVSHTHEDDDDLCMIEPDDGPDDDPSQREPDDDLPQPPQDDVTADDDRCPDSLQELPNAAVCNDTDTNSKFTEFYNWMMSPDGGLQHEKSAKQHVAQVKGILAVSNTSNISVLWDQSVLQNFRKYASQRKYLPGTSKSYLTSLKHFYRFLLSDSLSLSPNTAKQINAMTDRVALWITSFRKDSARHCLQKMDSDIQKLLTPDQLTQFRSSQTALDAVKVLGLCTDASFHVTQADFVLVRDFLMTEITLDNANRSGVLANITVGQLSQARVVDGCHVVSVLDHKTAYNYGPAKIVLSPALHRWLKVYAQGLRTAVVTSSSPEQLFLTWNGEALISGQVTRAVQSAWKKAGLSDEITANLVRKTAVTAVHETRPDMSNKLADLMCHRVATAQKCYRLVQREKSSVCASKTLSSLLKSSRHQTQVDESSQLSTEQSDVLDQLPTTNNRFVWSSEQLQCLQTVFDTELKTGHVSLEDVREKVKTSEMLQQIDARKVYDRLRAEIHKQSLPLAKNRPQPVSDIKKTNSDTEDSDIVGPSTTGTSRKDIFNADDVKVMKKLCGTIIAKGPIADARIKGVLNLSTAGQRLMHNFSITQIKNRIKYERRKSSSKYLLSGQLIKD